MISLCIAPWYAKDYSTFVVLISGFETDLQIFHINNQQHEYKFPFIPTWSETILVDSRYNRT